jgi:hypothetical protein
LYYAQALANEVLLADSGGRFFFFLQTMVKHYDPSSLPFSYLANTAQVRFLYLLSFSVAFSAY